MKCKYFKLYELLPKELYKNEEEGWDLLNPNLLVTIDKIREILGVSLICNNWKHGGSRNNCGLRSQDCKIGVSKSQHKLGNAVDLISTKMSAEDMRKLLKLNSDKLPFNIRIENDVTWLHVDMKDHKYGKIHFFNA